MALTEYEAPQIVYPKGAIPAVERMLDRMAAIGIGLIKQRAFGSQPTKSVTGGTVKALSLAYRRYKSGTYPYKSDATLAAAKKRRAKSGEGLGPLVVTEGGAKRRLTPKTDFADQVLSGGTRRSLGLIDKSVNYRLIGFGTERGRTIAEALQDRNNFMGFTESEREKLLAIAQQASDSLAKVVVVTSGSIEIVLPI